MADLVMPKLSDSMEEGTILRWLKADGEQVAQGEELVEIETDKATVAHEAEAAGVLRIVVPEGETVPVGAVIAALGEAEAAAAPSANGDGASAATAEAAPVETAPGGGPEPVTEAGFGDGVRATPVARRVAQERGIDLATVRGSGPGGRVVKADVAEEMAAPAAPPTPAPAPAPAPAPVAGGPGGRSGRGEVTEVEPTRTQALVARRMAESKATIPDFAIATDVEMGAALDLRAQAKAAGRPAVPSLNDMVVKACGLALREHPKVNGSYRDGKYVLHGRVNVGIAVATDDALVVPTVFDADEKPLGAIAAESRALAERVRAGTVTPPELSGGTFTISNLGMYGVTEMRPVIYPPQAAILGVGAVREVASARLMTLTLVGDHRILNGADAAAFLARVRELLQQPLSLLL